VADGLVDGAEGVVAAVRVLDEGDEKGGVFTFNLFEHAGLAGWI